MFRIKKKSTLVVSVLALIAVIMIFRGCTDRKTDGTTGGSGESGQQTDTVATERQQVTETEAPTGQQPEKLVAFSFDDGPGTESTGRILDVLEKYGFTATFFVVGRNISESNEYNLVRAVELGCEIGNHTWSHNLDLNTQPQSYVDAEIEDTNARVKEVTGVEPRLVRIPGGLFKDLKVNIGYPVINWTVDTNDWRKKGSAGNAQAASDLAEYILKQVDGETGAIVLMHDVYQFSAETVETVVPRLAEAGYRVVSVSELAEANGVELEPNEFYRRIEG